MGEINISYGPQRVKSSRLKKLEDKPVAKKNHTYCQIRFMAMQAKPGAELASLGINMPEFTKQFNDATKDRAGDVVPVVITAYDDKSFDFILNNSCCNFIKKAAGIGKRCKQRQNSNSCYYFSLIK